MERIVYLRTTRPKLLTVIRQAAASAAGHGFTGTAVDALMVRIGLQALKIIRDAFIVKADHGTDEAGLSWPPLKRETVAYSRRHQYTGGVGQRQQVPVGYKGSTSTTPLPGKRAKSAPSWMLTDAQRKRWWALYLSFGGRKPVGAAYHAKANQGGEWAAARAWAILKAEGTQTIIGVFGDAPYQILRSSGALLNTLSPGVLPSGAAPPVPPPEVEDQVFRTRPGEVIVGTNRKWAGTHHRGKRRLWAQPDRWPARWWELILAQARLGIIDITLQLVQRL